MSDIGLTHIALPVTDMDRTLAFYEKYARMKVVHPRIDAETGSDVSWISDLTRPFVIVLIKSEEVKHPLLPMAHLGVGCQSRSEVDGLCDEARLEGVLLQGPWDYGPPVGYWALIRDPDGHTLEVSYGQEVRLSIEASR